MWCARGPAPSDARLKDSDAHPRDAAGPYPPGIDRQDGGGPDRPDRNNAELAKALDLTLATVKTHVSHILTKLDLDNRTQIALPAHDADLA